MSKTTAIEWRIHQAMEGFGWCACQACRTRWIHEHHSDKALSCPCRRCSPKPGESSKPLKRIRPAPQPWEVRKAA